MNQALHADMQQAMTSVNSVVFGKQRQIKLAFCALLARGHVLIEDVPGLGKTTLARAMAAVLGLPFKHVQFTSDMLPADLIGVNIFNHADSSFRFNPGPMFTSVLLSDEINRAMPKSQSALLEAMADHQISVDGHVYKLPEPFFVIATQNPHTQIGVYPLPESQLDRFILSMQMDYPEPEAELALLNVGRQYENAETLMAVLNQEKIQSCIQACQQVHASQSLLAYVRDLLIATRESSKFRYGLSPRAGIDLVRCARAWVWLEQRDYVKPEDIQTLFPVIARHRLISYGDDMAEHDNQVKDILQYVDLP